jgi:Family of unknown function (DUF5677)
MPVAKHSKQRKRTRSGKNRTQLSGHALVGKQLVPPFAKLGSKVAFTSWMNDRMPDMLWAVIIRGANDQRRSISEFRRILNFIGNHREPGHFFDLTHSGIAKLPDQLRNQLIAHIVSTPSTAFALCALKLFKNLPARADWLRHLPDDQPNVDLLMTSVGLNLGHQSQEATDCRWVRLMGRVLSGKMHGIQDRLDEWLNYPYVGDQRSVRPGIRASEMVENPLEPKDLSWPEAFWQEAWEHTPCLELVLEEPAREQVAVVARSKISSLEVSLQEHWNQTHSTTAIDAKHDAIFGISFYALRLVDELLGFGVGVGALGRLGLRTVLELHLTLRYLIHKNDSELWKKWRTFGAGQAKLNALRFDSDLIAPKHIRVEALEEIAGEDLWEEFLTIELGSWSNADLRKMSENSGSKETYDTHYSWTSGYVHGTWGAVRESGFHTCGNPLHRLHRYPCRNSLKDTVADAVKLFDLILEDLNASFPGFEMRLKQ